MLRIIVMLMPAHPRASSVQVHSLLPLLGPFPCLVCPTLGHDEDDEGPTGGSSFAKLSEGITRTHVNRMAMAMDSRGFWFLAGSCWLLLLCSITLHLFSCVGRGKWSGNGIHTLCLAFCTQKAAGPKEGLCHMRVCSSDAE